MVDSPEAWPFAEAAAYYDAYRPPYAPEALELVLERFQIGPGVRVLDLGCGPGTLAIPLALRGAEVVAVDPDLAMLSEARRLAAERRAGSIRWICARAEDVLHQVGAVRLVTFGQSLHWMDRDAVLAGLSGIVEDGGGLAIFDEPPGHAESWGRTAAEIAWGYVGRPARHPMKHPESAHEPSLLRSGCFSRFETHRFGITLTRNPASILGCIYSGVHTCRSAFGDRIGRFEAELLSALRTIRPSDEFDERAETLVLLARKSAAGP